MITKNTRTANDTIVHTDVIDDDIKPGSKKIRQFSVVKPVHHYSSSRIRKNMWPYLLGRGMAAIGSFAVAILLVRTLPVETYGVYTALSGLLLTLGILSDGGLDRIIPKFIPLLRTANAEAQLSSLCWKLLGLRLIFISAVLIPLLIMPEKVMSLLSIQHYGDVIWAFTAYTLFSIASVHLSRTLQALLMQGAVTTGMAIEWFTKLAALLIVLFDLHTLPLLHIIWIHAITIGLGALYMLVRLKLHLNEFTDAADHSVKLDVPRARLWKFGWHNYVPNLLGMALSPGTTKLVSAYFLGITQTAALGFAYSITGMVRQYLPAILMLGLIEPAFMSRYTERKDFSILNELGSIVLKINLFVLTPITVWLATSGTPFIDLITGGKYLDTVWLISGLLVFLMLSSHFLVLQLICNAAEESWLLFKCNAWSALVGLIQIVGIIMYGLPGFLAGMLIAGWFENHYLVLLLRKRHHPYQPDWQGIRRIIILAVLSGLLGSLMLRWLPNLAGSLLSAVITELTFLSLAYLWKPFTGSERNLLNRFMGRKLFVW